MEKSASFVQGRLRSLDTLRGFDMFWIIGGEGLVHAMSKIYPNAFWASFSAQLEHPYWDGFTFYDLIFPLFIFLAGVSTPFSIAKALDVGKSKKEVLLKVIKRGLILFLLGIVYNNGLEIMPIADIRFMSVLGRIGIAYVFANIIYLYAKESLLIYWFGGLLIAYWLILKFNSAPGFPMGDLSMEGNFASYFDRIVLPGKLSRGIHDTVGLFNNIPAIGNALAGIITGIYLQKEKISPSKKALFLALGGLIALFIAQLWNLDFPINKNLWSSSFVMQTVGLSLLLFALFYYIIDVRNVKKWTLFFQVIGMNSILIYISGKFIKWNYTTEALFTWFAQLLGDPYSILGMALGLIIIKWLFLKLLFNHKIFLRV
ncbi:Predicted acyltransferase [Spirosomataceae bacterium TFI 002]|nr:Predicted acyltransferase [Spirosomataceae bacterium TFI 002]